MTNCVVLLSGGLDSTTVLALAQSQGCDYSLTRSCYDPRIDRRACGRCDACQIRSSAFQSLGLKDPAL